MNFESGDKVMFKRFSTLGAGLQRLGQLGTVITVHDAPPEEGTRLDISFPDGKVEHNINARHVERKDQSSRSPAGERK